MTKTCYEFMSKLAVGFIGTDKIFTYDFLVAELHISRSALSHLKQGRDMYIHQYLRVICFVMGMIGLTVFMPVLLLHIRKVLAGKCDLVIGTIPHDHKGKCEPDEWSVVMTWKKK